MYHLEWSLEWSQMIWGQLEWPGCEGEVVIRLFESVDVSCDGILDCPL